MPGAGRRRFALGERGVTSLEFAFVGGLFVMMLVGTMEMCRYMFTLHSVRDATAEAVNMVIRQANRNVGAGSAPCTNLSGPLTGVTDPGQFLKAASLTVTMSNCVRNVGVYTVDIVVTYPFTFVVPYFGAPDRPITEVAQAPFPPP